MLMMFVLNIKDYTPNVSETCIGVRMLFLEIHQFYTFYPKLPPLWVESHKIYILVMIGPVILEQKI